MSAELSSRAGLAPFGQGLVISNAHLDTKGEAAAEIDSNLDGGNPVYPGAGNPNNKGVFPHEIAWVDARAQRGVGASMVLARTAFNGEAGAAARQAPSNYPFVKDSFLNGIKLAGVTLMAASSDPRQSNQGISLQVGGLARVRQGRFADVPQVLPMDPLVVDAPLGGNSRMPRANTGAPVSSRYLLFVRPLESKSVSARLHRLMRECLTSAPKFRDIMNVSLRTTDAWTTALKHIKDSYMIGGLLMLTELMDAGVVDPSAQLLAKLGAFRVNGNDAAAPNQPQGNGATRGQRTAAYLAANLKLVVARDANGAPLAAQTPEERSAYNQLAHRLANIVFAEAGDRAHAFGVYNVRVGREPLDPRNVTEPGDRRATGLSETKDGHLRVDVYGQLRGHQINHFTRAASGFHHALLDENRRKIGFAVTGATVDGFVNINVVMG